MKNTVIFLFLLISGICNSQEICNNAIDDDADGLIDLNDTDCQCNQPQVTSLLQNPSFEDFTGCPSWDSGLVTPGWIEANQLSPDFINPTACEFNAQSVPLPFPDGSSVLGQILSTGDKEYIGSCLNGSMTAGTNYQLIFKIAVDSGAASCLTPLDPINITLYGAADCSALPLPQWGIPNSDTPFVILGTAYYLPQNSWGEISINFTPTFDVNTIILGSPEFLPETYNNQINQCRPYFLYDNLILNESAAFGVTITNTGNYCTGDLLLTANIPSNDPVNYQWYLNNIAIIGATTNFYQVPVDAESLGDYRVMVNDATGCEISTSSTVTEIMPGPNATSIPPTCSLGGSITVTTTADSFSFDGGATWVSDPTAANLPPGTYSVKIRYDSGCTSGAVAVNLPIPQYLPAPTATVVDASCGPTGSITITTPASQYSFDDGLTWTVSATSSNLAAGTYLVKIKDATGCLSDAASIFVDQQFLPDPMVTTVQPGCTNSGSITITTQAAEYSFDNGVTWSTDPQISNVGEGFYGIVIRDAQGCVSQMVAVSFTTSVGMPLYTFSPPGCGNNGVITFTTPAAEYSFDGGLTWQASPTMSSLGAGVYDLQFKTADGCISNTNSVTLFQSMLNLAPTFTSVNAGCDPGSITITTPAAAFSFDGGSTWQTDQTLANLTAGTYILRVRNAEGCISFPTTATIASTPGSLDDPTFTAGSSTCADNGNITITTAANSYSFDGGNSWVTSNIATSLAAGDYFIRIRSATGCESNSVLVTIASEIVPLPLTQNLSYCQDEAAAPLTATGSNLLWYAAASGGTGSSGAPIPQTSLVETTTYYVSQTINGCESGRAMLNVTVNPPPQPPVVGTTIEYCQFAETQPLSAVGSDLLWYTSATGGTGSLTAITPSSEVAGTFTFYVTQSNNGCESARALLQVIIKPASVAPQTEQLISYDLNAEAVALAAVGIDLVWYDQNFNILPEAPTPQTSFSGTTRYYVSQNTNGCQSTRVMITVTVGQKIVSIDYPKYFTPNGDGYHDYWNLILIDDDIVAKTFIFDRYGKLITQIFPENPGWDGTLNGYPLPSTDYWFVVEYEEAGASKELRAHFSLKR